MFDPPSFNPELPCELLAENTFEALRIVRQGEWVYKFLRPHDSFPGQTADERRRQILLRVRESHRHLELNPLVYDEARNCVVSRYIDGRPVGTRDAQQLARSLIASNRGYLLDVVPNNLVATGNKTIAIDFAIDEQVFGACLTESHPFSKEH